MYEMNNNNKNITIPSWLDEIIFNDFEAIYQPRPLDVVYNPDQSFEFVRVYLGTYFPRSYAEAYHIINNLLLNDLYKKSLSDLEELDILDFCCGTGGELVGLLVAINENLPNVKRVKINAYDANPNALRHLYKIKGKIERQFKFQIILDIQCLFVETKQHIQDVVNFSNVPYHFILSFKAINEFVQKNTFGEKNPYELIALYFSPLLANNGILIITDVTSMANNGSYYPQIMNSGLNRFLKENKDYKTIIPNACYFHEQKCFGCYMQDTFLVTHSRKVRDITKIIYRILCKEKFALDIMIGKPEKPCRATKPQCDKNLPYNN